MGKARGGWKTSPLRSPSDLSRRASSTGHIGGTYRRDMATDTGDKQGECDRADDVGPGCEWKMLQGPMLICSPAAPKQRLPLSQTSIAIMPAKPGDLAELAVCRSPCPGPLMQRTHANDNSLALSTPSHHFMQLWLPRMLVHQIDALKRSYCHAQPLLETYNLWEAINISFHP